jgi:site-specific DNA-cytosine methylase
MTAKSRWMTHVKKLDSEKLYWFNDSISRFSIDEPIESYPAYKNNNLINGPNVLQRALGICKTYKETRDKHSGQTRLSTSFQNGVLDPHNVFFQIANEFKNEGADFTINDGPHASMLRQFAFREMTIIQARRSGLTMEDSPEDWAKTFLTQAYNITFCDANGTRKDRPNGGLYVNETNTSNTLTRANVGTYAVDTYNGTIQGNITATMTTTGGGVASGPSVVQQMRVRRLTPMECERLQGFLDNYTNTPTSSDTTRYKALGNSMAVPVMKWIGQRINEL